MKDDLSVSLTGVKNVQPNTHIIETVESDNGNSTLRSNL